MVELQACAISGLLRILRSGYQIHNQPRQGDEVCGAGVQQRSVCYEAGYSSSAVGSLRNIAEGIGQMSLS